MPHHLLIHILNLLEVQNTYNAVFEPESITRATEQPTAPFVPQVGGATNIKKELIKL